MRVRASKRFHQLEKTSMEVCVAAIRENLPEMRETFSTAGDVRSVPGIGKIPWRKTWQPVLVFLPMKFHGQRRLAGYGPLCCKELDISEVTEHQWMPLQGYELLQNKCHHLLWVIFTGTQLSACNIQGKRSIYMLS